MRAVEDRQDLLRPVARRVVGYAVAKAIKEGLLPGNAEWYKWNFTLPARMTADYGRDSNADREDYLAGITNLGDIHYEFSAGNKLISKTVHHFLMRQVGGDLTVDNDPQHEAVDVRWFEIENLDSTLAHENERRMGRGVQEWLARQ